jgi:hypothetical protein
MRRVAGHTVAADRAGYIPPSRADIAVAIPPGSRRARLAVHWRRDTLALIEAQPWQARRRDHWTAVADALAKFASWQDSTTRPGHAVLRRRSGVSEPTVKRVIRWLRAEGRLGMVRTGSTPLYRSPLVSGPAEGNEAAIYVLTEPAAVMKHRRIRQPAPPAGCRTDPPSWSRSDLESPIGAREATSNPTVKGMEDCAPRRLIQKPLPSASPRLRDRPKSRIDARGACMVMQDRAAPLRSLTPEHIRHLARDYFRAGWTPGDVLHALDYEPTGRPHGYVQGVHHAAGWVRHRLGLWVRDGEIMRSRSQCSEAAAKQLAAEQARDRARREAVAAKVAANPAAHAAYARQLLNERRQAARQSPRAQPQPRRINTVNRDQPPHSDEAVAYTVGLMLDVGHNTVTGTPIARRNPAAALAAVREAIEPFWQWTNPETARDVMIHGARLAWQSGVTSCPEDLADDSAETMLEFTAATVPDVSPQAAWAFASSVAFDRDEDAETFQTLCVLLVLAYLREPDEQMEAERSYRYVDREAAD